MEPFTLFSLACLLAGVIITWIIRRLFYEKNHVPVQEHELLKQKYHESFTANTVNEKLLAAAKADLQKGDAIIDARVKEVERLHRELTETSATISGLRQKLLNAEEKLSTQKEEIDKIGERFEATFKALAASILDDKSKTFSEQQEANLKNLLQPLKENIATFRQELENRSRQENNERISLQEQLKLMVLKSDTISQQANNLAEALRGSVKKQGSWGEMILERMLEHSGLQKGVHYELQNKSYNDDGRGIQPDATIRLPGERCVVVDSKVSLVHYDNCCATKDLDEQERLLHQLVGALKAHIDGLAPKNYHQVQDALDLIIMFIPMEGAYISAMNTDSELWQYAYNKGILLISPSNFILALKLVHDMWQKDGIDKNAEAIALQAGKIYDKLAGFIESYENMGRSLQQAIRHYDIAWNQLKDGRGNLVSQAEQMKKLHIKARKTLPIKLTEEALLADGLEVPEEDAAFTLPGEEESD